MVSREAFSGFGLIPWYLFNISDVVKLRDIINPMLMHLHQHRVSHIIALRAIPRQSYYAAAFPR